jgi:hypothetical protein
MTMRLPLSQTSSRRRSVFLSFMWGSREEGKGVEKAYHLSG